MLRKKEVYTNTISLPSNIPRKLAIDILHNHGEIISLNPLVISHTPIKAPRNAPADEYYSTWYEITERVRYVPGTISFKGCFHDEPWGLKTHTYAPMGVDLRKTYRIIESPINDPLPAFTVTQSAGNKNGGLCLREDVEIECNITLISFVKSQLRAASKILVDRLIKKAELLDAGVLHGIMEDGVLRTYNPADRTHTAVMMQPDERSRRSSYQVPMSPSEYSRSESMTSQTPYAFAQQYRQDPKQGFTAELPADTYYPMPGPGKYKVPPDGGYPAELPAMNERPGG
ncbi:similar to An18g02600 [Aspergillus niger]|uniref:Similar to An18g02600 n=1 Tax=Aspergillus niger TaxID=5061 RepID=A0A117E3X7_ASPNG|nr:similar to An18g02600 [Aspergillus niger]